MKGHHSNDARPTERKALPRIESLTHMIISSDPSVSQQSEHGWHRLAPVQPDRVDQRSKFVDKD